VAGLEQNVLGFDVPVHDVVTVGVAQRVRYFARDPQGVFERELPLPVEAIPQRLALEIRHHVIQ